MLLTKAYLNELVQKKQIIEEFKYSKSSEPENYDIFISYNYHDQAYAKKNCRATRKIRVLSLCRL